LAAGIRSAAGRAIAQKHVLAVEQREDGTWLVHFDGGDPEEATEEPAAEEPVEEQGVHDDDEEDEDRFASLTGLFPRSTEPKTRLYYPRKGLAGILVRAETEGNITEVVASTPAVDRVDDIVEQDWVLDHYKENPVALFAHDPTKVVGRAVDVGVKDGVLRSRIEWDASEANDLGRLVAHQFSKGFLRAISVGFSPGKATPRHKLAEDDPRKASAGLVLSRNELLEQSAVSIPANRQALAVRSWADALIVGTDDQVLAATSDIIPDDLRDQLLEWIRTDSEIRIALAAVLLSQQRDTSHGLAHLLRR
jgi:hypothetical protein